MITLEELSKVNDCTTLLNIHIGHTHYNYYDKRKLLMMISSLMTDLLFAEVVDIAEIVER